MTKYMFQEFPKWIGGVLVQDAAEERAHLLAMTEAEKAAGVEPVRQPSAVAIRMQRSRRRRREGKRVVQIEVDDQDIALLMAAGHLAEAEKHTPSAIGRALAALIAKVGCSPRRP
jgi:hypothetical protein